MPATVVIRPAATPSPPLSVHTIQSSISASVALCMGWIDTELASHASNGYF